MAVRAFLPVAWKRVIWAGTHGGARWQGPPRFARPVVVVVHAPELVSPRRPLIHAVGARGTKLCSCARATRHWCGTLHSTTARRRDWCRGEQVSLEQHPASTRHAALLDVARRTR